MAVLHKETIDLEQNGSRLTALVVRPAGTEPLPGVVLIQEWWGIEPHIQDVAQRLAGEGFVVLVPDLYHGTVVTEPSEAEKHVMIIAGNLENVLGEIQVAIATLKARPDVAPKQVSVMGFCVGGFVVWMTALRTPDLAAVVPWYGLMFDLTPAQLATVAAPVLAVYGAHDTFVPLEQAEQIKAAFAARTDSEVYIYPDAGHAFLNPSHGAGHDESALDAWQRSIAFLKAHMAPAGVQ